MMDEKLKKELQRTLDRPRPRPLMFIGWRNGKKVYVRKQSLSYFQLLEKYPPPHQYIQLPKPRHIFQRQHHLKPIHLREQFWGYVIFGSVAAFTTFAVIFYVICIIKAFL